MKDSIKRKLKSAGSAVCTAVATAAPFMPMALAAAPANSVASDVIQEFLGYVVDMFLCIGILLGVWAIAQLALSFKNEDADSKSRAMMMLIVAAILLGVQGLAEIILNAAGLNITIGDGFI